MFGFNSVDTEKEVDSGNSCPEHETINPQDIPGKEITSEKEVILNAVGAVCQFFATMQTQQVRQDKKISEVIKAEYDYSATLQKCFDIAAECQKQTSELANQSLERHALHPSILAVDLLAGLIRQMARDAGALMNNHQLIAPATPLVHSILDAARIVESKTKQLEMVIIHPNELDEIDGNLHEIVKAVSTDNKDKNRKIAETITSGLYYRGQTLRLAKVTVYRFNEKDMQK